MSLSRWKSVIRKRQAPFSADLYGETNKSGTKSSDEEEKVRGLPPSQPTTMINHEGPKDAELLLIDVRYPYGLQIKRISSILANRCGIDLPDAHDKIRDVLRGKYSNGDVAKAVDLLVLHDEASCGIVKEINKARLLGAENNGKVTCYLDSLLFALFARLDSFEAMLYNIFDDEPRRRMSTMIRLFVNLLRTGKLITTDIIQLLQNSIAMCGWEEAAALRQQDASEAFTFITEKLDLPLLTLKMEVAHGGKEAMDDDHRFVSERLLNLAIPESTDGEPVKLESCLDSYFSNRIEVRRELERRQTIDSVHSFDSSKGGVTHMETADLGSNPVSPIAPPNITITPITVGPPSIIRQATLSSKATEALVPAWCFFSVLPFYTEGLPNEQSSFTQHFAEKRPVLGLCLKRYAWTDQGQAVRIATKVEIPLEIPLPPFVSGDEMDASAPVYGNFKLVLKSAVCHRGKSVQSGHYIALVRGDDNPEGDAGKWLQFNDLADERVTYVDHQKAFDEETPYLLFYQVTPIEDEPEEFSGAVDNAISGRPSVASLASSLGEKKLMMPEIFAPTPEEARTPPPEYSETPPLTASLRPESRGHLEPESAERGRASSDKTTADGLPGGRKFLRGFSKDGKESRMKHDRSASANGRDGKSAETSRERESGADKRDKRSSMPSLSLITVRKSFEFRRGLEEAVEFIERKQGGEAERNEVKGEKPLKKSKSKDSPTWGGRVWNGIIGGDKDKDRNANRSRGSEEQTNTSGEAASVSTADTVGSSLVEEAIATSDEADKVAKGKRDKGKEKEKEKEKDKEGGSWKKLSKALGLSGRSDKGERGESSKSQKVDKEDCGGLKPGSSPSH